MEKLTKTELTVYHSDQAHRKEPLVANILEDQQRETLSAEKETGRVKDEAVPVVPEKGKEDATHGEKLRALGVLIQA